MDKSSLRQRQSRHRRPHARIAQARFRPQACDRRGRLYRRHCPNRQARCTARSACRTAPMRTSSAWICPPSKASPGVVWVLTGKDVPGANDVSSSGMSRRAAAGRKRVQFHGQPIFAVIAETPRRGPPRRAAGEDRLSTTCRTGATSTARCDNGEPLVTEPMTLKRGEPETEMAKRAAPAEGHDAHRRAGAFLSRKPHRHGHSGRGRRGHRLVLDPASERDPAHRRPCPGHSVQRGDGAGAAHGRRLRRQGNAGQPVRRPRRHRRQEAQPRRQIPARPRRGHGRDRQAPRFPRRLRGRLRRRRPHPRGRRHLCRALRLLLRPVRPGHRPRAVPCRFQLFLSACATDLEAAEDPHRLQHRLSRLRRAAGHGRRRAHHRGNRLCGRQGSARNPQAEFLRPAGLRPRRSRPITRRSRTTSSPASSTSWRQSADYQARRKAIIEFNAHQPLSSARASR